MSDYQANKANAKAVLAIIEKEILSQDEVLNISVTKQKKGSSQQHKAYWVLISQIQKWLNNNGVKYQFGTGKMLHSCDFDSEKTHELIMHRFYPVTDGKRESLTKIIKNKDKMCWLIDKIMHYFAERGLILKLESDNDFGYYEWLSRQEQ